jgi:hypothetical protein
MSAVEPQRPRHLSKAGDVNEILPLTAQTRYEACGTRNGEDERGTGKKLYFFFSFTTIYMVHYLTVLFLLRFVQVNC